MRHRLPLLRPVSVLVAIFILTAVAVFAVVRLDRVVVAPGRFTGATVAVRAPLEARITEVLVAPGQTVAAGQPLLRFDTAGAASAATIARARAAQLASRRDELAAEATRLATAIQPAELAQARREAERAQLALQDADRALARARELGGAALVSAQELQRAELDRQVAALEAATKSAAVPLLAQRQDEALATLRRDGESVAGDLAAEELAAQEQERLVALGTVVAPAAGRIAGANLFELPQRYVEEGTELLRLERGAPARFEGWLNDHGRSAARPGQRVKIRVSGLPWLLHGSVQGAVEVVGAQRVDGPDGSGFPVVVSLTEGARGPGPLADGMTGQARLSVGRRISLGRLLFERLLGVDRP
jgi:multidrug resistance efflux pump